MLSAIKETLKIAGSTGKSLRVRVWRERGNLESFFKVFFLEKNFLRYEFGMLCGCEMYSKNKIVRVL